MGGTQNAPLDADKGISSGMAPGMSAAPVDATAGMAGLAGVAAAEAAAHVGSPEDAFRAKTAQGNV